MILDKIESLLAEVKEMKASNAEEIEALRLKYLSKKGEINAVWQILGMYLPTRKKRWE